MSERGEAEDASTQNLPGGDGSVPSPLGRAEVLRTVQEVEQEIDTVVSVGIASKCRPDGSIPHEEWVYKAGFSLSVNGKTNLGLGRTTNVAG